MQRTLLGLCRLNLRSNAQPFLFQSSRSSTSNLQRYFSSTTRASLRYHPPPPPRLNHGREFLGFLDRIPHNTIFYGIIGLNSAVFAMWFLAAEKYVSQHHSHSLTYSR